MAADDLGGLEELGATPDRAERQVELLLDAFVRSGDTSQLTSAFRQAGTNPVVRLKLLKALGEAKVELKTINESYPQKSLTGAELDIHAAAFYEQGLSLKDLDTFIFSDDWQFEGLHRDFEALRRFASYCAFRSTGLQTQVFALLYEANLIVSVHELAHINGLEPPGRALTTFAGREISGENIVTRHLEITRLVSFGSEPFRTLGVVRPHIKIGEKLPIFRQKVGLELSELIMSGRYRPTMPKLT